MKHRQFKTECICMVEINEKTFTCKNIKESKKRIYISGIRGKKYRVDIIDKVTGVITDIYLMYYTREGPIFQKQMYSKWKEQKQEAKQRQYNIFTNE